MHFTHSDCQKSQRSIVTYYHILVVLHTCIRECQWDLMSPLQYGKANINTILNCLESRKYCEAIMDDLLLFTPSKQMHRRKLEDLLKALLKNGLKICPRKCQLFKTELQYMGNTIFIQGKRVCVKPLHSQLEAIQKLEPPKTVKGCRSFAGMVNFLSIFCQDLQKNF